VIQWFVEAMFFGASCRYLRDLASGQPRKDWGYEVLVYWPEIEEVIQLWRERQQEDERVTTLQVWQALQDLEHRPGADAS